MSPLWEVGFSEHVRSFLGSAPRGFRTSLGPFRPAHREEAAVSVFCQAGGKVDTDVKKTLLRCPLKAPPQLLREKR